MRLVCISPMKGMREGFRKSIGEIVYRTMVDTIQITLNEGRALELKKLFYKTVAERLHGELGVRLQDVFINLVEVKKENWSFGDGIAQYA